MERIEGQVARILNVREVVLNRGAEHGVKVGMKFAVLNTKGFAITDPESGHELGSVEVPKALVQVVRLHDRMSVARTYRTQRLNLGGSGGLGSILKAFEAPDYTDVPETLRIEGSEAYQELEEKDSLVKVGDPAVQVRGDEFEITPP